MDLPPIEDPKALPDDELKEITSCLQNALDVRLAIREKHPIGNKFVSGSISCPICKDGIVNYIISDHYNGHIHGHCTKEGCVSWME